MKRFHPAKLILSALVLGAVMRADSLFACAACFGKTDSPLAEGMNWGIMSLLVVVVFVLSGIAGFGIYLAKKSASVAATAATATASATAPESESTHKA